MLNGFANENMSQNRFMARTRQLNNSFSNAIGTKEVTPLTDIYKSVRKAPIGQLYANAIGSKSKTSTVLINPVGFAPYKCGSINSCGQGHRCITNGTNVATGEVANWCVPFAEYERLIRQRAFDGGFANAIGTPTKFNPVGYTPAKCVGGRCGSGLCCLKNGTNVATGVTADWCVPCSDFQKFDGGFANVNGGCGCGCSDNGFLGL
jgi:hypothetical protein